MTANYSSATEAVIYLKDGKRKYGMLFNGNNDSYFQFISNNDLPFYEESNNPDYIEIVPEMLIESIDIDLK